MLLFCLGCWIVVVRLFWPCGRLVVTIIVVVVIIGVGGAISVATFTSARQITGQHVAIKITARQLSPQIDRSSKNVASARATTKKHTLFVSVVWREFMAQNT